MPQLPAVVEEAQRRAASVGFTLSSDHVAGQLLALLCAAVPRGGRVLEIGTGCGVGTAWIVSGLDGRDDVSVVSVEIKPELTAVARQHAWPAFVDLRTGSIFNLYDDLGQFELIFADSGAGKWEGRDRTLAALSPGGVLLMDDMTPPRWQFERHEALNEEVRLDLRSRADFVCTELAVGTGILLGVKKQGIR